jgi:hypothetical protein
MESHLLCKCPECGKESILVGVDPRDARLEQFEAHISTAYRITCPYCQREFGGAVAVCRVVKATPAVRPANE